MPIKAADAITAFAVHESTGTSEAEPACYRSLHAKISKKTAAVAVCGMGYVGLPLCRAITDHGFPLIGLDIDEEKVEKLNAGKSYIRHIPAGIVQAMLRTGRFRASSDFDQIAHADIIIVCVPTPLTRYREPDLSYVSSTAEAIARNARPGQLVILEFDNLPRNHGRAIGPDLQPARTDLGPRHFPGVFPRTRGPRQSRLPDDDDPQDRRRPGPIGAGACHRFLSRLHQGCRARFFCYYG